MLNHSVFEHVWMLSHLCWLMIDLVLELRKILSTLV